jgi:hypothetical protein
MMRSSSAAWLALLGLLWLGGCAGLDRADWRQARRDSSGLAPSPEVTSEAVVQVYAARTVGWRALAVHSWIIVKPRGVDRYTRYEVIGWGVERGLPAVRVNRTGPDNYWFGSRPTLLVDRRGDDVDALIAKVEAAIASYPYPMSYRTWPGPNSNTFIAHIGRAVPELGLEMPPTAIGKDFLPGGGLVAPTPSGQGVQVSVLGLAGLLVGWEEGLEVNILGLTFGLDVKDPALKVPGFGRLGVP